MKSNEIQWNQWNLMKSNAIKWNRMKSDEIWWYLMKSTVSPPRISFVKKTWCALSPPCSKSLRRARVLKTRETHTKEKPQAWQGFVNREPLLPSLGSTVNPCYQVWVRPSLGSTKFGFDKLGRVEPWTHATKFGFVSRIARRPAWCSGWRAP